MKIVGYPFSPKVVEKANCGPTVLASLLGVDTDEAMQLMDKVYKKGWNGYTNIGHIKAALKHHGIAMNKTKDYDGIKELTFPFPQTHVLLFIQIEGPWEKSKYWRASYNRTHWCLGYGIRILDVNNSLVLGTPTPPRPRWELYDEWQLEIMPRIAASFDDATGWHVKSGYYIEEM